MIFIPIYRLYLLFSCVFERNGQPFELTCGGVCCSPLAPPAALNYPAKLIAISYTGQKCVQSSYDMPTVYSYTRTISIKLEIDIQQTTKMVK